MNEAPTPFTCHIFVCSNCRDDERKSCDHNGARIAKSLKCEIKDRGWKGRVRVSKSGCLGVCDDGPNVMIYPQGLWYKNVAQDDVEGILSSVEEFLKA